MRIERIGVHSKAQGLRLKGAFFKGLRLASLNMDDYQSAKEEIKRAADIAELIGQYVQLKKAGQNFLGLCPFHSEKAPSFTVSPSKQMFHCFGCKTGGDIFRFWMEYHKVSFPQAMRDLADRYHITLPERRLTPSEKQKMELRDFLFRINEIAADYFHRILLESEKGRPGRDYLNRRSISKGIIQDFHLGYSHDEWEGLVGHLTKNRVDMDKAVQAGVVIPKKNGGYYDRFRGRVIFPIYDLRNRVVGFGGRVLDESLPKYLNTPETPIFHKGKLLYGIQAAYQSIRESGRAVVVEGYTDVLALREHGFKEAVATLGTALTTDHIRNLKGYTREAVLVFDADAAGKGAAIKSLPLFQNEGLSSRVMVLPEGDDPDSFINERGLNDFLKLLDTAMPIFEFYLDLKLSQINQGVEGQMLFLKEMLPVLSELNSASLRSLYTQRLSEKSGISEPVIMSELETLRLNRSHEENEERLRKKLSGLKAKGLDDLPILNLIIHFPHTIERLIENDCRRLLSDPTIKEIFDCICHTYEREGAVLPEAILDKLEGESVQGRFREILLLPPFCEDEGVEQALQELKEKVYKIKLSESLESAMKTEGNLEERNQLLLLKREKLG